MPVEVEIGTTKLIFDPRPKEAQEKGTGVHMWDSGKALADYCLAQRRKLKIAGSHVLELGAGCGLGGLGAAVAGAKSVILSDIEEMCGIIGRHILMNDSAVPDTKVVVCPYKWGESSTELCNLSKKIRGLPQDGQPDFDFIIGADVVFTVPMVMPLLDSLFELASTNTKIIIVFEKRCHITYDQFFVDAEKRFLVKEVKLTEKPNPFISMFMLKKLSAAKIEAIQNGTAGAAAAEEEEC